MFRYVRRKTNGLNIRGLLDREFHILDMDHRYIYIYMYPHSNFTAQRLEVFGIMGDQLRAPLELPIHHSTLAYCGA